MSACAGFVPRRGNPSSMRLCRDWESKNSESKWLQCASITVLWKRPRVRWREVGFAWRPCPPDFLQDCRPCKSESRRFGAQSQLELMKLTSSSPELMYLAGDGRNSTMRSHPS